MANTLEKVLHYMFLCHQRPDRSFFYNGKLFPICARCTGILIGYFIGIFYIVLLRNHIFFVDILFMLPLIIDGTGQYYGKWESTNIRRLVTGVLAGISTICLLMVAGSLGYNQGQYISHIIFDVLKK